uniref:Uncharacterized protein n=1 Tax=Sphaerodactylus townsendi TaxID=933632 RepID=A0ACB8ELV8_9SAUR
MLHFLWIDEANQPAQWSELCPPIHTPVGWLDETSSSYAAGIRSGIPGGKSQATTQSNSTEQLPSKQGKPIPAGQFGTGQPDRQIVITNDTSARYNVNIEPYAIGFISKESAQPELA